MINIEKSLLAKSQNSDNYIYPETSADIVWYKEEQEITVEDELDKLNKLLSGQDGVNNYLGIDPNLDEVTSTGFYTYTNADGYDMNIVVQNYPDMYTVQYQFINDNIMRRYCLHPLEDNTWVTWTGIGDVGYDPNSNAIVSGKTIKQGLNDANRYGLKIGNVLNGEYIGFSSVDLAYIHEEVLKKREAHAPFIFNLRDKNFFIKGENIPGEWFSSSDLTYDDDRGCFRTSNDGYITITPPTVNETSTGVYAIIEFDINAYYPTDNDVIISAENGSVSVTRPSKDDSIIHVALSNSTPNVNASATISYASFMYINAIRIYYIGFGANGLTIDGNIINVNKGDSAGLINAFKFAWDGCTINIPEGIYNIGICDNVDYSGKLILDGKNIKVNGAGDDKTFITGSYINRSSVICSALHINETATECELSNFTIVTEYIGNDGQHPTVNDNGIDTIWNNVNIIGSQDTLVIGNGSHLFKDCLIEGTVDFICGGDTNRVNYFRECILSLKGKSIGNVICAPSAGTMWFDSCSIVDNDNYDYESQDGKYSFGREWESNGKNVSKLYYRNTRLVVKPSSTNPYTSMSSSVGFSDYGDFGNTDIAFEPISDYHTPNDTTSYKTAYTLFDNTEKFKDLMSLYD